MRIATIAAAVMWIGCSGDEPKGTDPPPPDPEPLEITDLGHQMHPDVGTFATVHWTQDEAAEVHVEFTVDPGEWVALPAVQGDAGRNEQLVLGIPYAHSAAWRVVHSEDSVEAADPIETAELPNGMPEARLSAADPSAWLAEGRYLLTSISVSNGGWGTNGPFFTVILDRRGRPVWSRKTAQSEWTLYASVAVTGDHILYDQFNWLNGEAVVFRSYLDGVIEEIQTPGFHHAFVELPDGTLSWASWAHGGGEAIVEKAPGQADETILWTCADDWPEAPGNCHSNCLYYDVERDTYLYSFYSLETVVEIDRGTGSTLWWAGEVPGGYRFEPRDSQFYWQHGVSWTPERTLLVSTHDAPRASYNLAREYVVDEVEQTLTEIWSYDAEALADTNGDTWRLSNGNTLHTLGSASEVKEVDPDGRTVWHLDFDGTKLMGRSEWIADLYPLLKPVE